MSELVTQELLEVEPPEVEGADSEEESSTAVVRRRGERGMVSAEWAVGLIAAVAIAGVLLAVVTSGAVKDAILRFILTVIGVFASHIGKA